ncbi:hypothetical protein H6P81_005526 [Aristolochia fimbriata]|uniref:Uncharacterized protein n=1 Tax=Aristolochia fimbriata TaxID=158543 RepID=A0AAV7EY88_ARIFI|nr:hypothetical protein H6P81_005526 [Aristolochia fimbriata]
MSATAFPSRRLTSPAHFPTKTIIIQQKSCAVSETKLPNLVAFSSFGGCVSRNHVQSSSSSRTLVAKCSSEEREPPQMKDLLSGMVDKRVEELLGREENRVLLDGLEEASQRVERARKELLEIERQEKEAEQLKSYVRILENRESEIVECQRELLEARGMVEEAQITLSSNMSSISITAALKDNEVGEADKQVERFESVKAAAVSAIVGTLAGTPLLLPTVATESELFLHLGVILVSCALFGVTFRYTVRRDLDNIQLKTGTSAAFGLIKGLAELEAGPPLEFSTGSFVAHVLDGAVYVSQSLLTFLFASIALDYCFKLGILSPFPIKTSMEETK